MPTYQYRCAECSHRFEQFQKFSEDPLTECPVCGKAVRRVIQPVGVVFKGSGWYITDNRKSNPGEGRPVATNGEAKGDSKSDAKGGDQPKAESAAKGESAWSAETSPAKSEPKPESKPASSAEKAATPA